MFRGCHGNESTRANSAGEQIERVSALVNRCGIPSASVKSVVWEGCGAGKMLVEWEGCGSGIFLRCGVLVSWIVL